MSSLSDRVKWYSDRGPRAANQDAVVVGVLKGGKGLAAVADGMGGRSAGEVASRRALQTVVKELETGSELVAAFKAANTVVWTEGQENPRYHGMGTTLVAMLQAGDGYHIANVGDSRAYRIGPDGIRQLTVDHSFTAEAVGSGEMTEEDASRSPWANALTRAIGTDPDVEVDVFGPFDAQEPHLLVLCTDGLHKALSDEAIISGLRTFEDNSDPAKALARMAITEGADDNVTVAVVRLGDEDWQAPMRAWSTEPFAEDSPTMEFQRPDETAEGDADGADPDSSADDEDAGGWTVGGVVADASPDLGLEPGELLNDEGDAEDRLGLESPDVLIDFDEPVTGESSSTEVQPLQVVSTSAPRSGKKRKPALSPDVRPNARRGRTTRAAIFGFFVVVALGVVLVILEMLG